MSGNVNDGSVFITIYSNSSDPIYAPPGKSGVKGDSYSDADKAINQPRLEYRLMAGISTRR